MEQPLSKGPAASSKNAQFQATHWSMVLAAGDGHEEALTKLCEIYWQPLYVFLRCRGYSVPDAEDSIQGFFRELLQKNYVRSADPQRGRFRSFLLAALKNFLAREHRREHAQKRGGGKPVISLEGPDIAGHYEMELSQGATPEEIFERRWALTVLDQAMTQLRTTYRDSGKGEEFDLLHGYLTEEKKPHGYEEEARLLNRSEGAIRVAVSRMRDRFGEHVRKVIADTVENPMETEKELQHLFKVLGEY